MMFFILVINVSTSQGVDSSEDLDGALSAIINYLLLQQEETRIEVSLDLDFLIITIPNIELTNVSECLVSPGLPSGLSVQVNSDFTGCEIVGVLGEVFSERSYSFTANSINGDSVTSNLVLTPASPVTTGSGPTAPPTISGRITFDRVPTTTGSLDFTNVRNEAVRGANVTLFREVPRSFWSRVATSYRCNSH